MKRSMNVHESGWWHLSTPVSAMSPLFLDLFSERQRGAIALAFAFAGAHAVLKQAARRRRVAAVAQQDDEPREVAVALVATPSSR